MLQKICECVLPNSQTDFKICRRTRQLVAVLLISLIGCYSAPLENASSRHRHHPTRQRRSQDSGHSIPKLLHYIYLTGLQAYTADSDKPDSRIQKKYFEGCQKLHQHWDSLFWDEKMGLDLIQNHYSWFLPVWESFDGWGKPVKLAP